MMTRPLHVPQLWIPTCAPRRGHTGVDRWATITCRVCGAHVDVPLDNPVLLCRPCRADRAGAHAQLDARVAAANAHLAAASARFRAVRTAAHPADQQRYAVVVATVAAALRQEPGTPALARVLRSLARAGSAGDGLATLLAAEAQLRQQVQQAQATYEQVRFGREACLLAFDDTQAE